MFPNCPLFRGNETRVRGLSPWLFTRYSGGLHSCLPTIRRYRNAPLQFQTASFIFIMYSLFLLRWRCLITLLNHIFDDRHCRERIWPAGIEREVCDNFARLFRCETVVHRFVQVERNLRYLTSRDERSHGDEASIARCEIRSQPEIAEQSVGGVLHQSWRNLAELLFDVRRSLFLGRLIQWKQLRSCGRKLISTNVALGKYVSCYGISRDSVCHPE